MHPRNVIVVGLILVLFGFLAPLLMVAHVIEASFALSFLSYSASVAGLFLGTAGAALVSRTGKG